ncbi:protein kinase [Planctomycetota bacterium]
MMAENNQAYFDEDLEERLNFFVEEFESARERLPDADVADFMPPDGDKYYLAVGAELLRVDLQFGWDQGTPLSLSDYQLRFPRILGDRDNRSDLAFEEYRMRRIAGEQVDPSEYATVYQINTNGWPQDSDSTVRIRSQHDPTVYNGSAMSPQTLPYASERFADFDLLCELGTGAFSRAFLAEQSGLANRPVVLKITSAKNSEAQQLAKLQHTNIVPIHSVHEKEDSYAICMPYFGPCTLNDAILAVRREKIIPKDGSFLADVVVARQLEINRTLAGKRKRTTTQPSLSLKSQSFQSQSYVNACVMICRQMTEGLRHAHQQGVAHRDLKPANVLLANHGPVMLLDFNLSDDTDSGVGQSYLGGTLPYAAPEHLQSILTGERLGKETDLYSVGVILHELLTGRLPFPARTGTEELAIREMIADRKVETISVRSHNPDVSPGVDAIVQRLLAPNVTDRYQDASQVCEDLQRHLDDQPLRFAPNTSIRERVQKWARRHPRLSSTAMIGTIASVVAITLAVSGFFQWRNARDAELAAFVRQIERALPQIRAYTSVPGVDQPLVDRGLSIATNAVEPLQRWSLTLENDGDEFTEVARLMAARNIGNTQVLSECLFLMANAHLLTAQNDAHARASSLDTAELLNRRAADLEIEGNQAAIARQAVHIKRLQNRNSTVLDVGIENGHGILDALSLIRERKFKEAIPLLETFRGEEPFDLSHWFLLGNCYAACERFSEADGCFTTCAIMWSESHLAFFQRGLCRLKMEQHSAAEDDFTRALERDPHLIAALINRSIARREQEEYQLARDDLDQAIKLNSPQTRIYFMRSELRKLLGDKEGARDDYQIGMETLPTDEQSYIRRAMSLIRRSPDLAIEDLNAAIAINPRSYTAHRNLAFVYGERLEQPKDAIAILDRMTAWSPRPHEEIMSIAVMYSRLGDRDSAIAHSEQALQITRAPKTVFQAACVYANTARTNPSDKEQAIVLLAEAIESDANWKNVAAQDSDFDEIRHEDGFTALINQ